MVYDSKMSASVKLATLLVVAYCLHSIVAAPSAASDKKSNASNSKTVLVLVPENKTELELQNQTYTKLSTRMDTDDDSIIVPRHLYYYMSEPRLEQYSNNEYYRIGQTTDDKNLFLQKLIEENSLGAYKRELNGNRQMPIFHRTTSESRIPASIIEDIRRRQLARYADNKHFPMLQTADDEPWGELPVEGAIETLAHVNAKREKPAFIKNFMPINVILNLDKDKVFHLDSSSWRHMLAKHFGVPQPDLLGLTLNRRPMQDRTDAADETSIDLSDKELIHRAALAAKTEKNTDALEPVNQYADAEEETVEPRRGWKTTGVVSNNNFISNMMQQVPHDKILNYVQNLLEELGLGSMGSNEGTQTVVDSDTDLDADLGARIFSENPTRRDDLLVKSETNDSPECANLKTKKLANFRALLKTVQANGADDESSDAKDGNVNSTNGDYKVLAKSDSDGSNGYPLNINLETRKLASFRALLKTLQADGADDESSHANNGNINSTNTGYKVLIKPEIGSFSYPPNINLTTRKLVDYNVLKMQSLPTDASEEQQQRLMVANFPVYGSSNMNMQHLAKQWYLENLRKLQARRLAQAYTNFKGTEPQFEQNYIDIFPLILTNAKRTQIRNERMPLFSVVSNQQSGDQIQMQPIGIMSEDTYPYDYYDDNTLTTDNEPFL